MMSPWFIQTFFRSLPRMCAARKDEVREMRREMAGWRERMWMQLTETLFAVKTQCFQAAVSEHLDDLGILWLKETVRSRALNLQMSPCGRRRRTLTFLLEC